MGEHFELMHVLTFPLTHGDRVLCVLGGGEGVDRTGEGRGLGSEQFVPVDLLTFPVLRTLIWMSIIRPEIHDAYGYCFYFFNLLLLLLVMHVTTSPVFPVSIKVSAVPEFPNKDKTACVYGSLLVGHVT